MAKNVQNNVAVNVTVNTDESKKAFSSLRDELKAVEREMQQLAAAGQQNSDRFLELQKRGGEIKDTMGDIRQRINALASDTSKLDAFTQGVTGIAAGFSIAEGASALFGEQSEELQKQLLKVQGAIALLNGVQEISKVLNKDEAFMVTLNAEAHAVYTAVVGTSTGALKAFRIALLATGIGAAIAAVALLVANWDKFTAAISGNTNALGLNAKAREEANKKYADEAANVQILVSEYENANTSLNRKKEIISKLSEISPNYFSTAIKNTNDLKIAQDKFNQALYKQIMIESAKQELIKVQSKYISDIAESQNKLNQDFETYLASISNTSKKEVQSWAKEVREASRSIYNERQADAKQTLEIAQRELDKESKAYMDFIVMQTTALEKLGGAATGAATSEGNANQDRLKKYKEYLAKRQKADLEAYSLEAAARERYYNDREIAELQAQNVSKVILEESLKQFGDIEDAKSRYAKIKREEELKEQAKYWEHRKNQSDIDFQLGKITVDEWIKINQEADKNIESIERAAAERRKKNFDSTMQILRAGIDISNAFFEANTAKKEAELRAQGKTDDQVKREMFEREKKHNLSIAYMNGAMAIASILAQYPKFDGGIAMAAALASAVAANAAQIIKIKATQYNSGASSGSATATFQPNSSGTTSNSDRQQLTPQPNFQKPIQAYLTDKQFSEARGTFTRIDAAASF